MQNSIGQTVITMGKTKYITKDIHEKLDYVFIRNVDDDIVSVTYEQSPSPSVVVESCVVNVSPVEDIDCNSYPVNRAIILWLSGGTLNTTESIRIEYTTAAGRILDEDIKLRLVEAN